ncbi:MAG: hypothetical protein IH626_12220 [Rhodospirillales bacterium]|nr:hypothetical protein [Rhodospirillales bacterium]
MMLDEAHIDTALQRMADAFLSQPRHTENGAQGWGQFLNRHGDQQVGLYGTCAGVIVISLAYGGRRIPQEVIDYLSHRWVHRGDILTKGPIDFALTLRLAWFFLALKLADRAEFNNIVREVDVELQSRIVDDFWVDWQIGAQNRSQTASEYAAAIVILAYTLPLRGRNHELIPEFIKKAATRLQTRLKASEPSETPTIRVILSAIVAALPRNALLRPIRKLVRSELRREDAYRPYSLRFVDYHYLNENYDIASRRDYSVLPSAALEVLLANGLASTQLGNLAALRHAGWLWDRTQETGFFSTSGNVLTTSKDQAWVALALDQCRNLLGANTRWNRALMRITHFGFLWNLLLPIVVLGGSALISLAPDRVFDALRGIGLMQASKPTLEWWPYDVALIVQSIGLIVLTAAGQPLGSRAINYVRGLLP